MTTPATKDHSSIEWEVQKEILEEDSDERLVVYVAKGIDEFGSLYEGSAHYIGGEFDEIKDIELV